MAAILWAGAHLYRKGHKIQRSASRNATCMDATDLWPILVIASLFLVIWLEIFKFSTFGDYFFKA